MTNLYQYTKKMHTLVFTQLYYSKTLKKIRIYVLVAIGKYYLPVGLFL